MAYERTRRYLHRCKAGGDCDWRLPSPNSDTHTLRHRTVIRSPESGRGPGTWYRTARRCCCLLPSTRRTHGHEHGEGGKRRRPLAFSRAIGRVARLARQPGRGARLPASSGPDPIGSSSSSSTACRRLHSTVVSRGTGSPTKLNHAASLGLVPTTESQLTQVSAARHRRAFSDKPLGCGGRAIRVRCLATRKVRVASRVARLVT